jgi:hypothetical protein
MRFVRHYCYASMLFASLSRPSSNILGSESRGNMGIICLFVFVGERDAFVCPQEREKTGIWVCGECAIVIL